MSISKRNLAKALGVTSAGVVAWKKPVVDAVNLPAHASSSCGVGWINGDSDGDDETQLDGLFASRCECEQAVMQQFPSATGATWGFNSARGTYQDCYAEFGWVCPTESSQDWETKSFEGTNCD